MQILCDGKVPSNELRLHKPCSAQVQAAKCIKMLQIPSVFLRKYSLGPRDSNTKRPKYCMLICLAFWFWPTIFNLYILHRGMLTHRDAFAHGCFYTEMLFAKTCFHTHAHKLGAFTHKCLHAQVLFYRDAFIRRSFCTQMRRHFYTDAFTQRCFHTGILLHTTVAHVFFTRGFSWHKVSFTHRSFYRNTLTRYGSYTGIHLYRGVFLHRYFCTVFFTKGCFCTRVLLDCDTFRQRNSHMGEAGNTV